MCDVRIDMRRAAGFNEFVEQAHHIEVLDRRGRADQRRAGDSDGLPL
jgi:hypothetical protein